MSADKRRNHGTIYLESQAASREIKRSIYAAMMRSGRK
jgi:hypothetical protein